MAIKTLEGNILNQRSVSAHRELIDGTVPRISRSSRIAASLGERYLALLSSEPFSWLIFTVSIREALGQINHS